MSNSDLAFISRDAKQIYQQRLRALLESSHLNEFVAIEPISGEYFLGKTWREAIGGSREKHRDRRVHAFRVGHQAAIQFQT